MKWTDRREKYRAVLAGDDCVHPGSVFDPLSARVAEDLGFEVGMFAGSVASMAVLGLPDIVMLTLTEFADQAYRICRASNMPLMVDADHGYGNALNVRRTVEELENAGIAGLTIEDTELPQAFGTVGSTRLISIEEGVGKMRAALDARQDPDLVIIGRTGAPQITDIGDAVRRIKAYEAAGVDAVFISGVKTRDQLDALCEAVSLPVMLGGSGTGPADRETLGKMGVRVSLQGHYPFMAAVQATYETLKALREGTAPEDITGTASDDTMKHLTRNADFKRMMKDYMTD
ncbi:MAG: isocitrate lyase/PEP mutase family protein [Proteobacteria bacterium]|nr:isocitrate lyase/PEP mutase family protein [Pseudomonadota bacterium]